MSMSVFLVAVTGSRSSILPAIRALNYQTVLVELNLSRSRLGLDSQTVDALIQALQVKQEQ